MKDNCIPNLTSNLYVRSILFVMPHNGYLLLWFFLVLRSRRWEAEIALATAAASAAAAANNGPPTTGTVHVAQGVEYGRKRSSLVSSVPPPAHASANEH